MKKLMALKSVVVCALVACGFAAEGFAGSNTKKVLNLKANGGKSISAGKVIINGNYSYTMTTWIKFDREHMPASTKYPNGYIFYLNDNVAQRATIYYDGLTGTIKFERRNGWTIGADRISTIDAPPSGEWHYLTCVYDKEAQERRIYLDGLLKTNETDTAVCSVSCNFGFAYCDWGHVLRGQVAEMSIWSKALTVEEINTIMTARPEGDEFQDCLAYWPFDEGDGGTTARDIATGQFPLTIAAPTAQVLETVTDFPDFDEGDPRTFHPVTINYPADKVTVTDNAKDGEKKGVKYLENSVVTFTATADSGAFVRWVGDVPEDQATSETITLTIDGPKMLCPIYSFGWQYDTKAKTMTDGYWTLKATVNANREMTVTGVSVNSDGGILNLDQTVTDENGATYSIVTLGASSFSSNLKLKEVWLPDALKMIGGTWWDNGAFVNCASLTKVTPFLPPTVNYIGICAFSGCSALTGDLVLGDKEGDFTLPWANTSLAYFQNTAIKSVTAKENVRWIRAQMFNGCSKLESVTLEGNVTNIEANAFAGCSALKLFSLGHRPETWPGYQGSTAYQCRFLVNAADPGWAAYMADSAKFTPWGSLDQTVKDKYTAAFPGVKKPIGLSKTLPANQWLCNLKEPGMKLIFR